MDPELGTLEAAVESARLALACPYATSAEFEAALITERRAAGAYGRPWRRQFAGVLAVAAVLACIAVLIATA
jgi:hypothetical protein